MYGLINETLLRLLAERHGRPAALAVLLAAAQDLAVSEDAAAAAAAADVAAIAAGVQPRFLVHEPYPDAVSFAIVGAAAAELGWAPADLLRAAGHAFIELVTKPAATPTAEVRGYRVVDADASNSAPADIADLPDYTGVLHSLGTNLGEFLQGLDALHDHLNRSFRHMRAPLFHCRRFADGETVAGGEEYELTYQSVRPGLGPLVVGLIEAVAERIFRQRVEVVEQPGKIPGEGVTPGRSGELKMHTVHFRVSVRASSPATAAVCRRLDAAAPSAAKCPFSGAAVELAGSPSPRPKCEAAFPPPPTLSVDSVFPFAVCFGAVDLQIRHVGPGLRQVAPQVRPGSTLPDHFRLHRPKVASWAEAVAYDTGPVIVTLADGAGAEGDRLYLKGEMRRLEDGQVVFLCSVSATDLARLKDRFGVCLSSLPVCDATRDLLLLQQQFNSEMNHKKELDVSQFHLNTLQNKTDALLYDIFPPIVADALREGTQPEPTLHPDVTILFTDIVTFTSMSATVDPAAVFEMLQHGVYKVETIGDCYMVAGGLAGTRGAGNASFSDAQKELHALAVCNFALAIQEAAAQVRSPATGEPLRLRTGIHTGSVMSGVVGSVRPRFCLFGDAVNTAARMESTSRPGKILLSAAAKEALLHACFVSDLDAVLLDRGLLKVKGKGRCRVYTLRAIGANLSEEWASGSSESSDAGSSSAEPHIFARLGRDFSRALSTSLSDVGSAFFDSPIGSPIKLPRSAASSGRRLDAACVAGKRWGLAGRAVLALGRWRKTGSEGRRRAAGRRERCEAGGEPEPRSPGFLPAVTLVANDSCASDTESEVVA